MTKQAFTLAEVLITLGIIGVVASMTLPALIQTNKNAEVEVKLKKVYSVMNQAILMSENENGPKEYWEPCTSNDCYNYYEKYLLPYLVSLKSVELSTLSYYNIAIYFSDGSLLIGKNDTSGRVDYWFFPNAKNFNNDSFGNWDASSASVQRKGCGKTFFAFSFAPWDKSQRFHYKKGFETFKMNLSEVNEETLKQGLWGCKSTGNNPTYCTALIQLNGWKIPKDYPFKVK